MKKISLILATILFTALPVISKDWTTIRVGTEGAFPPFNYTDKDGNLVGLEIDYVKSLCTELKVKCTFKTQDWDGMIPALLAKKYDIIAASMSITEERKNIIDFSNPYMSGPNNFVAKKGIYKNFSDKAIAGKKIGVQIGTISENFITNKYPKNELKSYGTIDELFLDLAAGRVDLAFNDKLSTQSAFLETPEGKDYEFIGPDFKGGKILGEGIGFGIRKEDQDLKKLLNEGIKKLYSNGKFKDITKNYFPDIDLSAN